MSLLRSHHGERDLRARGRPLFGIALALAMLAGLAHGSLVELASAMDGTEHAESWPSGHGEPCELCAAGGAAALSAPPGAVEPLPVPRLLDGHGILATGRRLPVVRPVSARAPPST